MASDEWLNQRVERYEKMIADIKRDIEFMQKHQFRLVQLTPDGRQDISEQEIVRLRGVIDSLRSTIDYVNSNRD